MSRTRLANRQLNPVLASLPRWVQTYRPHQAKAVHEIMAAFEDVDVVVLDAPTGSGKTLIAETVRRMLRAPATVYLCSSKSLQDQFLADYPYARLVKGRGNYPTGRYPERFTPDAWSTHLSCEDCTFSLRKSCNWCLSHDVCPYQVAKRTASLSDLAVLNTSYFLYEANGRWSSFSRPDQLVIVDECDTLESALMGYVSVEVSERRRTGFKWDPPKKVTVSDSWVDWLEEKLEAVTEQARTVHRKNEVHVLREKAYLANLKKQLEKVLEDLQDDPDHSWVYTGKERQGISFRPARVDNLGPDYLWRHGKKWLLMSATVISAQEILESLGCEKAYGVVRVPSTFPIQNRRVTVSSTTTVSHKNKEQAWPQIAKKVAQIAQQEDHNILVHSVSYALTTAIVGELSRSGFDPISYTSAAGRESSLRRFRETGGILVAPSLDRGIDLPDEMCRVQIVCKVPFPYLGDRQIAARLHSRNGQLWYSVQTVRTLVQMCGRAVRHEEDWARTYILDSQFEEILWKRSRNLFPDWFKEGLVFNGAR